MSINGEGWDRDRDGKIWLPGEKRKRVKGLVYAIGMIVIVVVISSLIKGCG